VIKRLTNRPKKRRVTMMSCKFQDSFYVMYPQAKGVFDKDESMRYANLYSNFLDIQGIYTET
jgi:hypothetical protein